jgi:deaminated glutathione amidase
MRIALAQFGAGRDKHANLERMLDITGAAAARGAELVLFPECSMVSLRAGESLAPYAEPLNGPFNERLSQAARRHGLAVVAGVYESIPDSQKVYNLVVAFGPDGRVLGGYRKVHLYDAFGYRESDHIEFGEGDTLVFALSDLRIGVETCYDLRFPEITRHLALRGAELVLLPAAWVHGLLKESHWEVLARARAIENTVYVAAADQVGGEYSGSSMLVDPMGVIVAAAGEVEALVVGEVDPERIKAVRARNPSLANLRPDVYERWQDLAPARTPGAPAGKGP